MGNDRFSIRFHFLYFIRKLFLRWNLRILEMKIISQFTITHLTHNRYTIMTPEAERFNGWAAMLGFVAAVGAYTFTGQIIPGIF